MKYKGILIALMATSSVQADNYYYVGINQGLYRNSEDGRPWLQAGMGIKEIEISLVYLGNGSHYENSRSKVISIAYLPKWNNIYTRVGIAGYKNVWHTYVPPEKGLDYYREENRTGIAPLLGVGYTYNALGLELVYYSDVGRLAGSSDKGFITANVNIKF